MQLENIKTNIWSEIPKSDNVNEGFSGIFITYGSHPRFDLLIFRDEIDKKHFVIEVSNIKQTDIIDPNVNGLRISLRQFKFNNRDIKNFIDLQCSLEDYLEEFTEIVKTIATEILIFNKEPLSAINTTVENWKAFWASRIREVLTEEKQIGLLCELIILERLCDINPSMALDGWKGPLGEKHDFIFSHWGFEIKGSRSAKHIHWVNGIDQLKKPEKKDLAFISFILNSSKSPNSISIQHLVEFLVNGTLKNKPPLIEAFYRLLISAGYSRVFSDEYRKNCYDIINCSVFHVDEIFPKFTSENLITPLSSRVSEIKYKIDLEGLSCQNINDIQLGNYFY